MSDAEKGASAEAAIQALYDDCIDIYVRAREVMIPRSDGTEQRYAPTRFKQQVDRGFRDGTLVPAVASIVRDTTKGFGHLAAAERPDLMVETLVIDPARPYHHLLSAGTVAAAKARMDEYRQLHG